jgi:uncharacterized SAM-dependent methyltransferase
MLLESSSSALLGAGGEATFLQDALRGLGSSPKQLCPKYFYDRRGSLLFDAICELPEYYLTRTELSILETRVHEIAAGLSAPRGPGDGAGRCRVVEPGAGSGTKTGLLLQALGPRGCVE